MTSQIGDRKTQYRRREGIHLSIARYRGGRGGFQGHAERTRFHREICEGCADEVMALLEPAIRFIHDKEAGR